MKWDLSKKGSVDYMKAGRHVTTVRSCYEEMDKHGRDIVRVIFIDDKGAKCWHSIIVSDKSISVLRSLARACRFERERMKEVAAEDFIGKRVVIFVSMNEGGFPKVDRWDRLPDEDEGGCVPEPARLPRPKPPQTARIV